MLDTKPFQVKDLPELTRDFLPLVAAMDSFLCWMALARQLVQDVLLTQFSNPVVDLSVSAASKFGRPDSISLVFQWSVRWPDHSGTIRHAQGLIAFELVLAMLQGNSIDMARMLQTGEMKPRHDMMVTDSRLGQCKKPWPYPITNELQMLSSYVYNQAWRTMTDMEAVNISIIKPKAQA